MAATAADYGSRKDFMVGKRIGGINVFGGGLALYDADGTLVGGLGVSGDASCADHNIAWKMRYNLRLDHVPAGVADNGKGRQHHLRLHERRERQRVRPPRVLCRGDGGSAKRYPRPIRSDTEPERGGGGKASFPRLRDCSPPLRCCVP